MPQSVVGELRINLKCSTASFVTELGKMPAKSKEAAQGMQDAFDKVSFGEARGGLMFVEDILGTKLPRHLNNLITTLPGVGAAMSLAFPVLGAVLLIEKIVEFTTKFKEAQEKIKAAGDAYAESALGVQRHAAAIEIDNLKLSDQLRILNGGVEKNGLKIAFEEARLKAEELTSQIQKAITAEKKLLEDQSIGFWKGLSGATQTADIVDYVVKAKAGIAELERTKEMALVAHRDAQAASVQKEIDDAYKAFQTELARRKGEEETARKEKITKDFDAAITRATNDSAARQKEGRNTPHQQETSSKQMQKAMEDDEAQINAAVATRAKLYDTAALEAAGENRMQQDQLTNARLSLEIAQRKHDLEFGWENKNKSKISTGSSFDANGKFQDAETTKRLKDQNDAIESANLLAKANAFNLGVNAKITEELDRQRKGWDEIAALTEKDKLADKEKEYRLQEAYGIISKTEAEKKIAALYAAGETKELAEKNDQITKQMALVAQLSALTNGGTSGSDLDKAAYARALADYQQFLLQKEKLREAADAKQLTAITKAAADQQAMNVQSLGKITSTLNSSVASWINGSSTFGQAFNKMWRGMASNAVMSLVEITEEQLIAWATQEDLDEKGKLAHAKAAYGATYANTADIPVVGPALAPVAGAAAFAAVMAFEQGGEVPNGVGGVPALLHPREMVLNANLADVVRSAAATNNGGTPNGRAQHATYAPTIHAGFSSPQEIEEKLRPHFERWARSEATKRFGFGRF
jgi:hypothetical protein